MNNLIGLEVGQKLKIKDIGILLGKDIPEKLQTNTKKSWLREFDTYCKYHKEKVSYVIDEIYESQIEKVDGRGKHNNHKGTEGNNDKFGRGFDELIKSRLLVAKEIDGTFKDIMINELFIFNELMKCCEDNINDTKSITMKKWKIRDFFMTQYIKTAKSITKDKFERALNRLQKKNIIKWHKYYVCITEDEEKYSLDINLSNEVRECENKALEEMGLNRKNIFTVYANKTKLEEFTNLTIKHMLENEILCIYFNGKEPIALWQQYYIKLLDYSIKVETEEEKLQNIKFDIYGKLVTLIHTKLNKIHFLTKDEDDIYTWQTETACREVNIMDEIFWACYDENFGDGINGNFTFVTR